MGYDLGPSPRGIRIGGRRVEVGIVERSLERFRNVEGREPKHREVEKILRDLTLVEGIMTAEKEGGDIACIRPGEIMFSHSLFGGTLTSPIFVLWDDNAGKHGSRMIEVRVSLTSRKWVAGESRQRGEGNGAAWEEAW